MTIPIIAVTALARVEDRDSLLLAGCMITLASPICWMTLLSVAISLRYPPCLIPLCLLRINENLISTGLGVIARSTADKSCRG